MKTTINEQALFKKIDVQKLYKLPKTIQYCKRCVISNQRPRIQFDAEGICNACRYWERKSTHVDWEERHKKLQDLCDRYRRSDGRHDVIVPSSGGKDSALVAHQLKYKYNMNPLTVTWAPHIYTEIGWENFQALIDSGLDNVLGTANGIVHQKLTRLCTIEMGEPFQPFIYGQVGFPVRMALAYDIPLIMDGENGEAEYGGDSESEEKEGFDAANVNDYWFSGKPLEHWLDYGIDRKDISMYTPPSLEQIKEAKISRHFFSYYTNWRPQQNYYYAAENTGFKPNPDGRSEGTYSKYASLDDKIDPFHFYFSLLKFGIARATSDAAHEVRENLISREEAVALVNRYDQEFPKKYFQTFLEYCGFTEEEFWAVCDAWRNENLWEMKDDKWTLKYTVS